MSEREDRMVPLTKLPNEGPWYLFLWREYLVAASENSGAVIVRRDGKPWSMDPEIYEEFSAAFKAYPHSREVPA